MAQIQDEAASDDSALEEVCCHKITFVKWKRGVKAATPTLWCSHSMQNENHQSQPNRWGQIIIKAAEPESWYNVLYVLEGEDTDSSRPLSRQEKRELGRNASASTGIINI